MDTIRQYILSVICVVIMCGLIQMIFPCGESSLIKLITGLVVTVAVISPVLTPGNFSLGIYLDQISADGQWAVRDGEQAAIQTASEIIKEASETYILDKAAEFGAEVTVDVRLSEDTPPVPTEITVKGTVSPYIKKQLTAYIQDELGIAEENQIWIS